MNPVVCPIQLSDLALVSKLLFYTYIPIVVIALTFSTYLLYKERGSILSRLLFLICIFYSFWVADILIQWISISNDIIMFSWQIMPLIKVPLFIFSVYFFFVILRSDHEDVDSSMKFLFLTAYIVTVFFSLTNQNILFYDSLNCVGIFGYFGGDFLYIAEIVLIFSLLNFYLKRLRSLSPGDPHRKEIRITGLSVILLLSIFSLSNLIGQITEIYEISLIESLGMLVFLTLIIYASIKYDIFRVKIIGAQLLVLTLVILMASQLFIPGRQTVDFFVDLATLFLSICIGTVLIRSIKRGIFLAEQKSEFVYLATHRIAGPLTAIRGYIALMKDSEGQTENSTKIQFVEKIESLSKTVSYSVRDFLNVVRAEDFKLEITIEPVELVQVVENLINGSKDFNFKYNRKDDYFIAADREKITTALRNILLCDFAIKEGTKIDILLTSLNSKIEIKIICPSQMDLPQSRPLLYKKFSRTMTNFEISFLASDLSIYYSKIIFDAHTFSFNIDQDKNLQFTILCNKPKWDSLS